ncbi:MAG TPA: pitrilysin family protein [Planctomycetota bacterium]|nr:pitrilysin family protein [Planctomycetota bacterium]
MNLRTRVREHRLRNGLLVLAAERRANPVVTSMIWYRVGSRDEATGETGLSHFLEHMLFKGTRRLGKGEIDLITARLGGHNNAFTDHDYTAYYFNFARDRWETAFAIEAERMARCLLERGEFESEKKVVLEELRMGDDDPWRELYDAVEAAAYQVHPYRHPIIGWKADLEALDRERMRTFYRRHYGPDRAVVVVAGDVAAREVFDAAERHFGKIRPLRRPRLPVIAEPPQRGERRLRLERDTPMRRLLLAFHGARCGDRDDYALDVLASLLTGGRASLLHRRLVKRLRVASHVFAENDARLEPGLLWVGLEVRDGVKENDAEAALVAELAALGRRGPAPRDLARAKRVIVSGQAFGLESANEIAERVGRAEVYRSWRYVDTYLPRIEAVGGARIREIAHELLDESRRTVGWSVPKRREAARTPGRARIATPIGVAARRPARRASAVVASPGTCTFPVPPRRGPAPVVRMPFVREVLDNGLTVLAAANPAAPTVSILAFVEIEPAREPAAKAGLEHLTGSCLEEGTRHESGDEIAQSIEAAGGFLESGPRGVAASVLARNARLAIETTARLLRQPTFPDGAVERRRDQVVSDLLADEDDLRTRAFRKLRDLVYRPHPLHRPAEGSIESVRRLRRDDLLAFHREAYAPERTILAVAGDVDPREIVSIARRAFRSWTARARPAPTPPSIPAPRPQSVHELVDREQVHVAIGHVGITREDPDYDALVVLDHVLGTGAGFTDRISRRLRDEQGLTYAVNANITSSAGKEPGIFAAYLSTAPENARRARAGLVREIERVVSKEPPTAEEVRTAKDYLVGAFPFSVERNAGRAQVLVQMERFRLGADYLETYPRRIESVSVGDVARVARAHLRPDRCVVVSVGPRPG